VGRAYSRLLQDQELKGDPAQQRAVVALDRLAQALANGRGILGLFGKPKAALAGVYLWGGVGRGKSMLMDLA
jgi:cell division protein ZapE